MSRARFRRAERAGGTGAAGPWGGSPRLAPLAFHEPAALVPTPGNIDGADAGHASDPTNGRPIQDVRTRGVRYGEP